MDYPCAKFGDFSFSFGFYRADRERQRERQTKLESAKRFPRLTSA